MRLLEELKVQPRTIIFYESPRRTKALLAESENIFGERQIVLARELTKKFEEVLRGTISEVIKKIENALSNFAKTATMP